MMTPLTLNTDRGVDGTPRVIATGEIDISNIHVFTEALTTASEGGSGPITVDMSAVKYLDSAGVNVQQCGVMSCTSFSCVCAQLTPALSRY